MGTFTRRLRYWLRQREQDATLAEELEFHRALKQQELEAAGMSSRDAEFAARREIGNATLSREDARRVWIRPWLESVWQDATYAVRSLRRQPGFTLVSVIVLGIAIGLNTSLFTVCAGLSLRPMAALTDPDRVVTVSGTNVIGHGGLIGLSFEPVYFQPLTAARGDRFPKLLFQTTQPSTAVAVTAVMKRLAPQARVEVTPMQDRLESSLDELGFAPIAASILGLFGLGLATVGMFGVFAYVVRQRTREI